MHIPVRWLDLPIRPAIRRCRDELWQQRPKMQDRKYRYSMGKSIAVYRIHT